MVYLNLVGIDGLGYFEGEITIFKNFAFKYIHNFTPVLDSNS